jgi:hypothetical protein
VNTYEPLLAKGVDPSLIDTLRVKPESEDGAKPVDGGGGLDLLLLGQPVSIGRETKHVISAIDFLYLIFSGSFLVVT